MGEFRMPSLGADMEVGTILEWRVAPGDTVHKGDIVAVVDTEKSDIEVEVFEEGVIEELLVAPGVEVPVGTPLARIASLEATGASAAATLEPEKHPEPEQHPEPEHRTEPEQRQGPAPLSRSADLPTRPAAEFVPATPRARRRARQSGIDLTTIEGSGPGGAVLSSDLDDRLAAAPAAAESTREGQESEHPEPRGQRPERREAMRRATGELMARSKREIPHYYLATTVDLAPAMEWLEDHNAHRPVSERVLPAAMLLKATAAAAREIPGLNGFWRDGFEPADHVHLGVAVNLRGGGLVAPAIHDADTRDIDDLMSAMKDLVTRARSGRLRSSETADPTITVTNLGDQGVEEVFGVIYPPQVALVGFGKVVDRPWADRGLLGVRPTVRATLSADHRVTDGHDGARFLSTIDRWLRHPEEW